MCLSFLSGHLIKTISIHIGSDARFGPLETELLENSLQSNGFQKTPLYCLCVYRKTEIFGITLF